MEIHSELYQNLCAFLSKDLAQNVYPLGLLAERGLSHGRPAGEQVAGYGLFAQGANPGQLVAAAIHDQQNGSIIPYAANLAAAVELGRRLKAAGKIEVRQVIGERGTVDAVVRGWDASAAVNSRALKLLAASADDLGPFVSLNLRLATPADLRDLVEMSTSQLRESSARDQPIDPFILREQIEAQVAASRLYVFRDQSRILVKILIGVKSRFGAQIEDIYTLQSQRHLGNATLALGQLSRTMLSSVACLTMRVDERELGLAAVCRKVGYMLMRPQRLTIIGKN